jgi:hypothetical protein
LRERGPDDVEEKPVTLRGVRDRDTEEGVAGRVGEIAV